MRCHVIINDYKKTGYHTKSLLTVLISDQTGKIVAVTQFINKNEWIESHQRM